MPFHATHGDAPRFPAAKPIEASAESDESTGFAARWSVNFAKSEDPAVGLFSVDDDGRAQGTFLTTLADYRYLEGTFDGEQLLLSCFDGAHAFLFAANLQSDGTLSG